MDARFNPLSKGLIQAVLLLQLSGCALSYTDSAGAQHIIGFANITIQPPADTANVAGHTVEVTSVGVLVSSHDHQHNLSLGYAAEKITYLKNNTLIGVLPESLTVVSPPQSDKEH